MNTPRKSLPSRNIMTRNVTLLGLAALLLIGLSLYHMPSVQRSNESQGSSYALLLPELKNALNDIDHIQLQHNEQTLTLAQDDGGIWRVNDFYDYPASHAQIRKVLLYLSQSEIRDRKTADPQKWSRLGLDEKQATIVTLSQDDHPQHIITLGNVASDDGHIYVRLDDDPQSYRASGKLQLSVTPADWLEYGLFTIEAKRIKQLSFRLDGKKSYDFVRDTPKDAMRLTPIRQGEKLAQRYQAAPPSRYLSRLAFEEVLPDEDNVSEAGYVDAITFDGLVIRFTLVEAEQRYFMRINARSDETIRHETHATGSLDSVIQEATLINKRTHGWLYRLGQFQMDQLTRSYFDVIQDADASNASSLPSRQPAEAAP